jgi:hypothetical protein
MRLAQWLWQGLLVPTAAAITLDVTSAGMYCIDMQKLYWQKFTDMNSP